MARAQIETITCDRCKRGTDAKQLFTGDAPPAMVQVLKPELYSGKDLCKRCVSAMAKLAQALAAPTPHPRKPKVKLTADKK